MLICKKCQIEKNELEFSADKRKKTGYFSICKECDNIRRRETRKKNREKINAKQREYYKNNSEKLKNAVLEYQKKNKEKVNASHTIWRKKNPDKVKKYHDKSRLDREKFNEKRREYYHTKKDPKKHRAHGLLNNYLAEGCIKKPDFCTLCLSKEKIEAHHPNYDEPLLVVWVCRKCHIAIHKRLKHGL